MVDADGNIAGARSSSERQYALGYSEREFKRLEQQGAFFRDLTEDVLRRAGLAPGMRVLDLGCGVGDVSLLAAELVGPSGAVLGIDRSPAAVETAGNRAAAAGVTWASFAVSELDQFSSDTVFDALIGRFVLMYLPDPAATLRGFCRHLVPGGIVAFQEIEMSLARGVPATPLFQQVVGWILATFRRAGIEVDMGTKLYTTFRRAGLPMPTMIAASRVEGGPDTPAYEYITATFHSLLPLAEQLGVVAPGEVQIDTLAERLRREALEHDVCVMPPTLIGAWSRVPG